MASRCSSCGDKVGHGIRTCQSCLQTERLDEEATRFLRENAEVLIANHEAGLAPNLERYRQLVHTQAIVTEIANQVTTVHLVKDEGGNFWASKNLGKSRSVARDLASKEGELFEAKVISHDRTS